MIVVEDTTAPNGPHPVLAVTGLAREARWPQVRAWRRWGPGAIRSGCGIS